MTLFDLLFILLVIHLLVDIVVFICIQKLTRENKELQDTVDGLWMFGTQIGDDDE